MHRYFGFGLSLGTKDHFRPGREAGAAAAAQARLLDAVDDRVGRHPERGLHRLVAAVLDVEVQRVAVGLVDVLREDRFEHGQARSFTRWQPLQRGEALRAQALDEGRDVARSLALGPVLVVHHDHRRPVTGAEALELHHREHAVGGGLVRLHVQVLAQFGGDLLGAVERARQRAAHLQHVGADRLGEEHHVVRDHVLDVGRRAADDLGDVAHRVAGDVALLRLHHVQRRDDRRLAALRRIVRAQLLELGAMSPA